MIVDVTKTDGFLTKKNVYFVASFYALFVCKSSNKKNSAFSKLLTLVMKTFGCSKDFIECFSAIGFCERYQSITNLRNKFSSLDELSVKNLARDGVAHIIFDNMDLQIKTLHQLTLPLLMFEVHPTLHLPRDDALSLQDTLELFNRDTLDLDSPKNRDEKEHFLDVVYNALAREISWKVKGKGQWNEYIYLIT